MVLFLTIVLIASSVSLIALLCAKQWEVTTGRMLFGSMRPRVQAVSHQMLHAVEHHLPTIVRRGVYVVVLWLRTGARAGIARALLSAEHSLEKILHALRRTTMVPQHHAQGRASAFLREVAEHKRRLVRRRAKEVARAKETLVG